MTGVLPAGTHEDSLTKWTQCAARGAISLPIESRPASSREVGSGFKEASDFNERTGMVSFERLLPLNGELLDISLGRVRFRS